MTRIEELKDEQESGDRCVVMADDLARLLAIAEAFRAEVDRAPDYFREEHPEACRAWAELDGEE